MPGINWDFPLGTILTYIAASGASAAFALVWMRRDVNDTQAGIKRIDVALERLTELMTRHEDEDHRRFTEVRRDITSAANEIHNEIESAKDSTGEVGSALRQKITDVEMWARDTFIRRDSFREIMADQKELLQRLEAKIDAARKTQMGSE